MKFIEENYISSIKERTLTIAFVRDDDKTYQFVGKYILKSIDTNKITFFDYYDWDEMNVGLRFDIDEKNKYYL